MSLEDLQDNQPLRTIDQVLSDGLVEVSQDIVRSIEFNVPLTIEEFQEVVDSDSGRSERIERLNKVRDRVYSALPFKHSVYELGDPREIELMLDNLDKVDTAFLIDYMLEVSIQKATDLIEDKTLYEDGIASALKTRDKELEKVNRQNLGFVMEDFSSESINFKNLQWLSENVSAPEIEKSVRTAIQIAKQEPRSRLR